MNTPVPHFQGLINEDQFERLRENALLAATSGIRASESDPVVPRPGWSLAPHADASAPSAGYMQTLQQSLARQRRLMEATTRQVRSAILYIHIIYIYSIHLCPCVIFLGVLTFSFQNLLALSCFDTNTLESSPSQSTAG